MTGAPARPGGMPKWALATGSLALAVFLGGFVFHEPAPYELILAVIMPAWLIGGLALPRAIGPLVVLLLVFVAGGVLSMTQSRIIDDEPLYVAVSAFLALSACFFAAAIARDPDRHLTVIVNAWIAAAIVNVALGAAGYFGLAPEEMFTGSGRAAGGFADPNVFGPFLVLPLTVLLHRTLTRPFARAWMSGAAALFLLFGILLSFSRAAWGLAVIAPAMLAALIFANERRLRVRARYFVVAVLGLMVGGAVLAAALATEEVGALFAERARFVQEYDGGHLGRFDRHLAGFELALQRPFGLGALEFGKAFLGDEHNIWLKSLTTYGWLGFAAFLTLVLWTLIAAFPLLFRTSRSQPIAQAAYVVFVGHILIATVIDIDHWRHVYLLFGILWGLIACDRAVAQSRLAAARPAAGDYRELVVPAAFTIERVPPPAYSPSRTERSAAW